MSIAVDCPACMEGNHAQHNSRHGLRKGLIGGTHCDCKGDCAERREEAAVEFAALFRPVLTPPEAGSLTFTYDPRPAEDQDQWAWFRDLEPGTRVPLRNQDGVHIADVIVCDHRFTIALPQPAPDDLDPRALLDLCVDDDGCGSPVHLSTCPETP